MLRVLVIADIHLDPWYEARASPSCRCRRDCINPDMPPMPYGQAGCDSPIALLDSILDAASEVVESPDLLLMLGDHMAHHLKQYVRWQTN